MDRWRDGWMLRVKEDLLNLPLNARAINAMNVYIIKQYSPRQITTQM